MNGNISTWLSGIGLIAAIVVALKISRQGGLNVKRLWIMPTITWVVCAAGYQAFGLGSIGVNLLAVACLVGAVIGCAQARLAIREIDLQRKVIVTVGGLKMLVIGLGSMAALQLIMTRSGEFDPKSFAKLGLVMGLLSISAEKLSYFLAYLRARQMASKQSIGT